ncbi:MAG TPA: MCP four helix bundle domain-containing protein [Asticcacaulis sp.]|nr:MCP four helix bundle domain-containing protein [Asticcacaulis sp.]
MSIRARMLALVGCFAAMALVVSGLGLATIIDYNRMLQANDHAYENAWRGERLNHLISNVVMETRGLWNAEDQIERNAFALSLNRNLDDIEKLLPAWRAVDTPAEVERMKPIEADAARFITLRREVARLATAGQVDQARALSTGSRASRIAFQAKVDALVQETLDARDVAKAEAAKFNKQRATDFLMACLLGTLLMVFLALWMLAQFITRPLKDIASAIIKTSEGDYGVALDPGEGKDEVAGVWRALRILKDHAIEAERLAREQREAERQNEMKLREILLD